MHLMKVDPRALEENPDRARQTKSNPQADALMLATIKAVGIVQPPLIAPETGGGSGHRQAMLQTVIRDLPVCFDISRKRTG